MCCTDPRRARRRKAAIVFACGAAAWVVQLSGCGSAPPTAGDGGTFGAVTIRTDPTAKPEFVPSTDPVIRARVAAAAATMAAAPPPQLPPPDAARDWTAFRVQAALRMVAANPHAVYDGPVPDPLLAIPVLEIELERDGRVKAIRVLRVPTQARDTIDLAIAAVRRAAPFGSVSHLPRPWKFAEVFLFDDARRFKPRTLDVD